MTSPKDAILRGEASDMKTMYDASLSTMWAIKRFASLNDFFSAASRLGFSKVELNHQVNSGMLAEVALDHHQFSSVHEPCPADISTETLKEQDWLISSVNADKRQRGIQSIQRSIDLAQRLGAPVVVVHSGMVENDLTGEKNLRLLFEAGRRASDEYQDAKDGLQKRRASLISEHLEAVKASLLELIEYAGQRNIRLGLENRYHFMDIPSLDEMGELLNLADSDRLGFIFDIGHANALDRLGFYPHEEWLKRYSPRILGVHFHDAIGVKDHYAPGLGELDFNLIANYLPEDAYRVCEIQPANSFEQVREGLRFLAERGCIKIARDDR